LPLLFLRQHVAPIVFSPGQFNLPADHLEWFVAAFPHKQSAQNCIPLHRLLPGLLKGRAVQFTVQGTI